MLIIGTCWRYTRVGMSGNYWEALRLYADEKWPLLFGVLFFPRVRVRPRSTALAKKTSARLRELATVLGAISCNLADVFLANAVQKILVGHFQKVNTLAG